MVNNRIVNKGDTFHNLTIIQEIEKRGQHRIMKCKCCCGKITDVYLSNLLKGHTKSCGCLFIKKITKHSMSNTKIYNVFKQLKQRCNNPKNIRYYRYGGRGIKCEWIDFKDFYKDMGEKYKEGLTIERVNIDGNYCKRNCKWIPASEQALNTSQNVNYKGKCLMEWSRLLKINYKMINNRILRGWDIQRAIFTPKLERYGK